MIEFYYNPGPNPMKVALFLEESKLPYEVIAVDNGKGEQHSADFKAINPNAKVPAIVDGDAIVCDSNARCCQSNRNSSPLDAARSLRR